MEDEDFLASAEEDSANAPAETQPAPEPAKEEPKQEEPKEPELVSRSGLTPAPEGTTLSEPATPTEPPVPTEATPAPKPDEAADGRLAALLDERDKRKALEAELAQYRAAQAQAQQQVQIPDPLEDPEAYAVYQREATQAAILNTKLDISEEMARAAHGDELVSEAQKWAAAQFQTNPAYQAEVLRQRNPYGYVIQQFKRQQALEKLGDASEIDGFLAWKQAQAGLQQQQAAPAAPPNTASAIPPRSLASAPSAGGINTQVIQSEQEIFEEAFPKRT